MMELSFYVQLKEHIGCYIYESILLWFLRKSTLNYEQNLILKEINYVLSVCNIQASDSSFAAYCLFNIYSMKTTKVDFKSAVLHLFHF